MARDTVAHRYAAALFLAARQRGELETLEGDARAMLEVIAHEPRLMMFLSSPEIRDDRKEAVLTAALGGRSGSAMLQFLLLMFRKHRVIYLSDALVEFIERAEEARGIVSAHVVTAVPLAADLAKTLIARLESLTGKKIHLIPDVDPAILGGAVVTIGDRILDGSVRGRLTRLREELISVRVH
jgi:F-type H+-transporting ATPase subunit delta